MIKTLQRAGLEGTYLNIIKAVYDKSTASIYNRKKTTSLTSGAGKTGQSFVKE